jgi:hypothetical protein
MKIPKVGDKIYVGSAYYVYRGEDDFEGGLATISKVDVSKTLPLEHFNSVMISIEERPNTGYNWKVLEEKQDKLKEQFGDSVAHPCPDCRPEFNDDNADWSSPSW